MQKLFETIHEDSELLVVNKPAGLVCHPTKGDIYSSLISRIRLYLGESATPHLVNRLDRETSGVVVAAKTLDSAVKLRRIWESREVRKEYLSIVHGAVQQECAVIEAPLGKDERSRVAIKDCVRADGAKARTEFWVERRFSRGGKAFTLLRVVPLTGRKHQIRIHLAYYGHPILGDKIYGGDEEFYLALVEGRLTDEHRAQLLLPHHGLHAREVRFYWRKSEVAFQAEPELWFTDFCTANDSGGRIRTDVSE